MKLILYLEQRATTKLTVWTVGSYISTTVFSYNGELLKPTSPDAPQMHHGDLPNLSIWEAFEPWSRPNGLIERHVFSPLVHITFQGPGQNPVCSQALAEIPKWSKGGTTLGFPPSQ